MSILHLYVAWVLECTVVRFAKGLYNISAPLDQYEFNSPLLIKKSNGNEFNLSSVRIYLQFYLLAALLVYFYFKIKPYFYEKEEHTAHHDHEEEDDNHDDDDHIDQRLQCILTTAKKYQFATVCAFPFLAYFAVNIVIFYLSLWLIVLCGKFLSFHTGCAVLAVLLLWYAAGYQFKRLKNAWDDKLTES